MGHGDHWECIMAKVEDALSQLIPIAINDGVNVAGASFSLTIRSEKEWKLDGVDPEGPPPIAMVYDVGPYSVLVLLIYVEKEEKYWSVWTAYPFLTKGVRVELEITEISPWGNGVEAEITGSTSDGLSISYFDCFFFRDAEKYEIGRCMTIELGAIAFRAGTPESKSFFLDAPDIIEKIRDVSGSSANSSPIEIRTGGMAALLPIENWDAYEYSFQGPVKSVEPMNGLGKDYYRVVATVCRADGDFDLPILVSQHVVEGKLWEEGEDIGGHLWVHGRMIE